MKYPKIELVNRIGKSWLEIYSIMPFVLHWKKKNGKVTDDPLKVGAGGAKFDIDLGAERIVAGDSPITDYHAALGQFLNYRLALELNNIDRLLYLAIPTLIYEAFFQKEFLKISIERYQIKLIVYEPVNEVIEKWIN